MNLSMKFNATCGKSVFRNGDRTACEIAFKDTLIVKLWYDFPTDPLTLTASAVSGFTAALRF